MTMLIAIVLMSDYSNQVAQHWRKLNMKASMQREAYPCFRRQITEDNKIKSPLMRLPAEIRVIILRVLVGDKLIHVFVSKDW